MTKERLLIEEEIANILNRDPAAYSAWEVLFCYPGLHAVLAFRVSHWLWQFNTPLLRFAARCIANWMRWLTGIEIHPGAKLGRKVFIDHGQGVVIGETAEVGNNVIIYQGVTLGAQAQAYMGAQARGIKRHPTLGNDVIVGSGAQVLGPIKVGNNVRIASGSIVVKDVPEDCTVVGALGRFIFQDGAQMQEETPDILAEAIKALHDRVKILEEQVVASHTDAAMSASPALLPEHLEAKAKADLQDPVDIFLHGAGI